MLLIWLFVCMVRQLQTIEREAGACKVYIPMRRLDGALMLAIFQVYEVAVPEMLAMGQTVAASLFRVTWRVRLAGGVVKVALSNSHVKSIGFPIAKRGGLAWFGFG